MTTYKYTLTLDDREMIALDAALDHYIEEAENQIKAGGESPFKAHLEVLLRVKAKRYDNVNQTSGNNFWVQYDKDGNLLG